MRISDWSSDVCSSDLALEGGGEVVAAGGDGSLRGEAQPGYCLAARRARHRQELRQGGRSEEHTSELQSLMRISYAVFCLKKKNTNTPQLTHDVTKAHLQ